MWSKVLLLGSLVASTYCHVTFTNLKCEMLDRKYGKFERCYIRAVNRTHKYIDVYAKMFKLPINNISIQLEPMHYNNGYKPFLLGMKFDACKYLSNPRVRSMLFVRELHATLENVSNLNHTCPYNHDLMVDKMWTGNLEKGFLKYLPVPNGDYAIYGKWYTYNIPRANVNVYFKITNK